MPAILISVLSVVGVLLLLVGSIYCYYEWQIHKLRKKYKIGRKTQAEILKAMNITMAKLERSKW